MVDKAPTPLENIVHSLEALVICLVVSVAFMTVWVAL